MQTSNVPASVTGPVLDLEKLRAVTKQLNETKPPVMKISTGSLPAFQMWVDRHTSAQRPALYEPSAIKGYIMRPFEGIECIQVDGMSPTQAVLTIDGVVRGIIDLAR